VYRSDLGEEVWRGARGIEMVVFKFFRRVLTALERPLPFRAQYLAVSAR